MGDLVLLKSQQAIHKHVGIIIEIDDEDFENDNIVWAKIMWYDGTITWEDMICSIEDKVFEVFKHERG
jgi:hypothetical protein